MHKAGIVAVLSGKNTLLDYAERKPIKAIIDTLVNGIPCDTVEEVTEGTATRVSWKNVADLHAPHWTSTGDNSANYWKIKAAVARGMLFGT